MFSESSSEPDTGATIVADASVADSWSFIVRRVFTVEPAPVPLKRIYAYASQHPRCAGRKMKNVHAKVRQVLERQPEIYVRVGKGLWDLRCRYSEEQAQELERLRHEQYPRRK
jgi:hypothetical protein